ncbi:methyltransferase domain-containing protein [Lentzea sp. BCCO 10_0856]|uniref:Methyltransferase domain-containing protein n=1 Tax=Lentzea miocenica TaxID=3095431 RepID=A0ABU4T7M0_9PSEU|nr:methyltransferase domain-containing protein [Lentzea sp. BCCO 10_0856]MDX8034151.1 methyltransferase domain-containing protein [Lentzea sp. BCCO 10_0856]
MTATEFDPVRFKEQQRDSWNAISEGWLSIVDSFECGAAVMTARLLELGGVRPGMRVLDVGTGVGEPALSAAGVVGPTGRVVGVDIAPDMIALARRRASGVDNVEFFVGDAESLDFPANAFDVALSRWGLMFAPDRPAAYRSLARVLRQGGVLAASAWGPPETAPMMSLGFQVLVRRLELPAPPPAAPGPFSMADPDEVTDGLRAAGFTDVSVTEFEVPFSLDSAEAYVAFNKAVTPPFIRGMLRERFGTDDDEETWALIGDAAAGHRGADGRILLPSKALCLRAVKPSGC